MAILDDAVFQTFFGRKSNAHFPIVDSLDDAAYSNLFNQYTHSLGWGCIPTEKGFAEWLNKKIEEAK